MNDVITTERMNIPTLEHRLDNLLGAAQALWHVAKDVDEGQDKEALMFIREALLENVRAVRFGLCKADADLDIQCPTAYDED